VGARLTFGLVLLAAATLVLGYTTGLAFLIYGSIACSALAAGGLLVTSRQRRERAQPQSDLSWPASLAEPAAPADAPRPRPAMVARRPIQAEPTVSGPRPTALEGAAPTRRRSAGPTSTLTPGPGPARESVVAVDPDDEPQYAARGNGGPSPSRSARPDSRAPRPPPAPAPWQPDPAAGEPAPVARELAPVARELAPVAREPVRVPSRPEAPTPPRATPVAAPIRRRPPPRPVEPFPFPIEDYEYLEVAEILPLLPELDDQELVEVLVFEQKGPNRFAVLDRIDALLEGEDW
jgi:hypothetical protein